MSRTRIVFAALATLGALGPAVAADLPPYPAVVAPPARIATVGTWAAYSPYYIVNQGPELSGPGIMVVGIGITPSGLHRAYPFIGRVDDLTPLLAVRPDYYGDDPTTIHRTVRYRASGWSRHKARARRRSTH
jgi:hypothetical protein